MKLRVARKVARRQRGGDLTRAMWRVRRADCLRRWGHASRLLDYRCARCGMSAEAAYLLCPVPKWSRALVRSLDALKDEAAEKQREFAAAWLRAHP